MIPGPGGSSMQRGIKVETRTAVPVFGGQTGSPLAGVLLRPFATGIAKSIFQGGMAIVTEAQDQAEGAGLPAQKKAQQADGCKKLSKRPRLHTSPR